MKRFFLIVLIAAIASTSWACASKDQKNTETAASHTSKKSMTTKPKVTPSKTTFANDTVKDIEAASADIESALRKRPIHRRLLHITIWVCSTNENPT